MCSFPDAQEFYRHPLKGFAVLHGLIYRAFEDYWDFKDNYFPPLFVGGVLTLPRGPQVSVPRGEVWGEKNQVREKWIPLRIRLPAGLGLAILFLLPLHL